MNIVVLHRIPFARVRYDLAVDHEEHTVRYLVAAGYDGLPTGSEHRVLDTPTSDIQALAERHADWLGTADRLIARSEYDLLPAARLRERFGIAGDLPDSVLPVRDKWLMRTLADGAKIPQPSFWSAPSGAQPWRGSTWSSRDSRHRAAASKRAGRSRSSARWTAPTTPTASSSRNSCRARSGTSTATSTTGGSRPSSAAPTSGTASASPTAARPDPPNGPTSRPPCPCWTGP